MSCVALGTNVARIVYLCCVPLTKASLECKCCIVKDKTYKLYKKQEPNIFRNRPIHAIRHVADSEQINSRKHSEKKFAVNISFPCSSEAYSATIALALPKATYSSLIINIIVNEVENSIILQKHK